MFQNLSIFRMSHAMAVHASNRQTVVSRNIANADTPGYVARDLPSFQAQFDKSSISTPMRHTRSGHFTIGTSTSGAARSRQATQQAPNGNSVSLEEEMLKAVDIKREHDRALAIYKSALGVMRTSLGRR